MTNVKSVALQQKNQQEAKTNAEKLSAKITKTVIEKRRTAKRLQNAQNCIYSVIDSLNSLSDYCDKTNDKRLILMLLNAITKFSYCDYSAEELDADMLRQELHWEIADLQFSVGFDEEEEARIDFHKNSLYIEY